MKKVVLTQRVDIFATLDERRDSLDQRWMLFIQECGFVPLLLPNQPELFDYLVAPIDVSGIILTGGGDLVSYGGNSPERDAIENLLIATSLDNDIPLVGVCRGMQAIQSYFGVSLSKVPGHIGCHHEIKVGDAPEVVNSFHELGATETVPELRVLARTNDGVIEAIAHRSNRIRGVMWHPERFAPNFRVQDLMLFRDFLGGI